ncbi:hypothetical protein P8452_24174 [Trifolium repens]|nr:hypothetical protein P8452_24174 [Trifolium repens]
MSEAPAQLNEQNDDPRIGKEVVAAPVDEPIEVRSRECGRNRKKLDEVNIHWKRLQYEEGGESDVSCLEELNAIQERFKLADHDMKLQIKEELRLIAYPETTSLKLGCPLPPSSKAWKLHRAPEAETWEYPFLDRMAEFDVLMENEKAFIPKPKSNEDDPIDVSD